RAGSGATRMGNRAMVSPSALYLGFRRCIVKRGGIEPLPSRGRKAMELQDIAVWAAIGVAGLTLAFLAFGRRGADGGAQQVTGRLDQLAAQQAAAQNALSERLQAQERALAAKLEERLNSLQDRVGQTLQSNAEQAGQTMTELRERLAVIDAAQKNITELS